MRLPAFSLPLRIKLLAAFILLSVIPVLLANVVWFIPSRSSILQSGTVEVQEAATHASRDINNFFATKVISLIIHSQTESMIKHDSPRIMEELRDFLAQDEDIQQLTLLNPAGREVARLTRSGEVPAADLVDASQSLAYKVTTYVGGSKYISDVYRVGQGPPLVDIAVPVVLPEEAQNLQELSTSSSGSSRRPGEIYGVLIEQVSLANLWQLIGQVKIHQQGYVYVIDDKGTVLTHPQADFVTGRKNLRGTKAVDQFLATINNHTPESSSLRATDEVGQTSLITSAIVPTTQWGVIGEVPVDALLSETHQVIWFAGNLFVIFLLLAVPVFILFSRSLVRPIKALQEGTQRIAQGDFDQRLAIYTGDELEQLGRSFNVMADQLQQREKLLVSEKDQQEALIQSLTDGVFAVDQQGTIVLFNRAAEMITGLKANDLIGQPADKVLQFKQNGEVVSFDRYHDQAEETKQRLRQTGVVFDHPAGPKTLTMAVAPVALDQEGWIISFHDVTKERELEAMKLDFVSMAAHELRTPLTAIRGYLSLLIESLQPKLSADEMTFLTRSFISSNDLASLVENLLNVSRIERGVFKLELVPLSMEGLIQGAMDNLREVAHQKNIQVNFEPPAKPLPLVMVDKFRISEVITNLVANGINYTSPGGSVTVLLDPQPDQLVVQVVDTGHGIPKQAMSHLFTKFYRVSSKLAQGSKGTGLGLYISKAIIDAHKGKIWVESVEGKGSTFSFSVPYAPKDAKESILGSASFSQKADKLPGS